MPGWNLSIAEETDRKVRAFHERAFGVRGDISCFVNDNVRRRVLDLMNSRITNRNAIVDQQTMPRTKWQPLVPSVVDGMIPFRSRIIRGHRPMRRNGYSSAARLIS